MPGLDLGASALPHETHDGQSQHALPSICMATDQFKRREQGTMCAHRARLVNYGLQTRIIDEKATAGYRSKIIIFSSLMGGVRGTGGKGNKYVDEQVGGAPTHLAASIGPKSCPAGKEGCVKRTWAPPETADSSGTAQNWEARHPKSTNYVVRQTQALPNKFHTELAPSAPAARNPKFYRTARCTTLCTQKEGPQRIKNRSRRPRTATLRPLAAPEGAGSCGKPPGRCCPTRAPSPPRPPQKPPCRRASPPRPQFCGWGADRRANRRPRPQQAQAGTSSCIIQKEGEGVGVRVPRTFNRIKAACISSDIA